MDEKIKSVFKTSEKLSKTEQDPPVRNFFTSFSELSDSFIVRGLLTDVFAERPNVRDIHLAYLLYVSLQYVTDFEYDEPRSPEKINRDISKNRKEIARLCESKNIGTNITNRYIHLQIILEIMNCSATVVDLGSSVGFGIKSINSDWSEVSIDERLSQYVTGNVDVKRFICVDQQIPDLQWIKACYLPENKEYRYMVESIEDVKASSRFEFHSGNAVELPNMFDSSTDVIWTSSMMYQIEQSRDAVERAIKSSLNKDGIWIEATTYWSPEVSEYNPEKSFVSIVRRKGNWDSPLEVLLSPDDTVNEVRPGVDFPSFESCI